MKQFLNILLYGPEDFSVKTSQQKYWVLLVFVLLYFLFLQTCVMSAACTFSEGELKKMKRKLYSKNEEMN